LEAKENEMDASSRAFEVIQVASRKGYRVLPSGEVESPHGRMRALTQQSRRGRPYMRFNITVPSLGTYPVFVHQFAAFQKFGEEAFKEAACVRHLNDDSTDNRLENIELGSIHDNIMDRPESERQSHAKRASETLSRKDWEAIDADREQGHSYKELMDRHGVSKGTLSYRYSQTGVRRRLNNR